MNLHGLTDPTSPEGHDLDKVMVIVKRGDPEQSIQNKDTWNLYSIQQLMEDRSWDQLRVPSLYFLAKRARWGRGNRYIPVRR